MDAEVGHAVAFAGPLKHAGYPITKGVRMILVLFLYVEDFHYGPYLTKAKEAAAEVAAAALKYSISAPVPLPKPVLTPVTTPEETQVVYQ